MADKLKQERIWSLLARKLSGEITQDEQAELNLLLQEHPYASYADEVLMHKWKDNYNYYQADKIAMLFQRHKQQLDLTASKNNEHPAVDLPVPKLKSRIKYIWRFAAAACIALAVFLIGKWWEPSGKKQQPLVYQQQLVTPKGSRSQIVLPDGSKVWLNAGSKLDYPRQFTSATRDVQLLGEAYFEIIKNNDKPFIVHTNVFDVKVLGTGFNVRAYPDEDSAATALVHGSVEVIVGKKEKRIIRLSPNEKITLPSKSASELSEVSVKNKTIDPGLVIVKEKMVTVADSVQAETAWINNKLAFKKMPLENVALLLEKWFGADIRFKTEKKKILRFSGVYEKEDLEFILYTLGDATGTFQYTKDSSGVYWIE